MIEKQRLREKIWNLLQEKKIARFPLPPDGRIPNFQGSEIAAHKLKNLPEWKNARVLVVNPDFAQKEVRKIALEEGKILIVPSPKIKHGYLRIDPLRVKNMDFASTIRGAFKLGERLKEPERPDAVVTGSVAVNEKGMRLGKGGGYGDKEIALIKEKFGDIPVLTTVHDFQIVDYIPWEEHDQKVDVIVTPTRVIRVID
jgi:5-formyltetrahydrofolate cyclo-ligase